MKGNFLNKKKQVRFRRLIISIVIIIAVICFGTIVYTKIIHSNKILAKAGTTDYKPKVIKHQRMQEKIIDKSKVILKNSNVSEEGKEYTYDALEIQKVLTEGIQKVDGRKIAFLTFDDGPSTTVTPKILQILKENDVHATFSLIGKQIEENDETKDLVKQEIEQGNAIGNHTYSHDYSVLYPNRTVNVANFMNEVDETDGILKGILGPDFHTRIIRMPGGHMSWRGTKPLDEAFNAKGYVYIDWNDDDEDSIGRYKGSQHIIEKVKQYDYGQDRLVIILHDTYGKEAVVEALPEIIQYLKGQGYEFKTLT